MHCFGIAADVICFDHGWQCKEAACGFFEALDIHARVKHFTRVYLLGKTGERYLDAPHVQGVPVAAQREVRTGDAAVITELLREYMP